MPSPYRIALPDSTAVTLVDPVWAPRLEVDRAVTVPYMLDMAEETGIIDNFARAAGRPHGDAAGILNSDAVLYKIVEAAAFVLARHADPDLAARVDDVIGSIAAAQEDDGYLLTHRIIALRRAESSQDAGDVPARWSNLGGDLELYIGGHLYEAAAAHYTATGKRTLLEVAIRHADLVDRLFGPDACVDVGGHPEIEPALVRLWAVTGEDRYWRLAKFFVDTRGTTAGERALRGPFSQDHRPIVEQSEAVGQAPRATYLYSGVTDVAAITGDGAYVRAMRRLWDDVVRRKLYITGGIGSNHENEGFGDPYDLPNPTAYTEICAAISFGMWAIRMFRLTGEAQFVDILERTLYNNFLAGVSLSGDRFFYACPPESDGTFAFNVGWLPPGYAGPYADATATRKPWFACACCPPNFSRWLEQIPSFVYATGPDGLYVNLYIAGEAELDAGGARVRLRQTTRYPWDGHIRIEVEPMGAQGSGFAFAIHLRIPGWTRGHPVPGDLYGYEATLDTEPTLTVNREPHEIELAPDDVAGGPDCVAGYPGCVAGYVRLARRWRPGDVIELTFPMPIRRVRAHPAVKANRGKVALERGPIVYCAEGIDHGGHVLDLSLPPAASLSAEHKPGLLGGVTVLDGTAYRRSPGSDATSHPLPFRAIPYALWSHRGPGEMAVWFRT